MSTGIPYYQANLYKQCFGSFVNLCLNRKIQSNAAINNKGSYPGLAATEENRAFAVASSSEHEPFVRGINNNYQIAKI
jgi:hypothetical protein